MESYKRALAESRRELESDEGISGMDGVLEDYDKLIQQWDFFETKLDIKVCNFSFSFLSWRAPFPIWRV